MENGSRENLLRLEPIKTPEKKLTPKDHFQRMVYPLRGALKTIEEQKSNQRTAKDTIDQLTKQFTTILLELDLASDAAARDQEELNRKMRNS